MDAGGKVILFYLFWKELNWCSSVVDITFSHRMSKWIIHTEILPFLLADKENERHGAGSKELVGISTATYGAEEQGRPC